METTFDLINYELLKFVRTFGQHHVAAARNFHLVEDGMSAQHVHHLVRLGRFLKKFEEPSDADEKRLHDEAVKRWLATDAGLARIDRAFLIRKRFADERLWKMKVLIHQWCSTFEMRIEDAWVGPGETYISAGGDVSEYAKFLKTERWTCTRACYPLFEKFILVNRPLKRWALEKARDYMGLTKRTGESLDPSQAVEMLTDVVLGARVTTVPKNNEKRRPINIEPLGNSIVQYAIGRALMRVLSNVNNDLFVGQSKHRKVIADDTKATLDLSDASDSISTELVRFLFPEDIFKLLDDARSKCTEVDGLYMRTNKVSCQGNGFTFPLMSMILLAACKACGDEEASVYGDDIIVNNVVADEVSSFIEGLGFKVNVEKSFISRQFRESCGGYYYSGYIRCFDIEWIDNFPSLCSVMNKIFMYAELGHIDSPMWAELHEKLLSLVPDEFKGPVPIRDRDRIDVYIWSEKQPHKHLKAGACHWLGERFHRQTGEIRAVQVFVPETILVPNDDCPLDNRYDRLVGNALRVRAGSPVKRHRRNETRWLRTTLFVDSQGALMFEPEYRRLRNSERGYLSSIFDKTPSAEEWEAWNLKKFRVQDYYDAIDEVQGKDYLS